MRNMSRWVGGINAYSSRLEKGMDGRAKVGKDVPGVMRSPRHARDRRGNLRLS